MSTWRSAGLNYVNYSNIAAQVLRRSLKADQKEIAMRRGKSTIRYFYWVQGSMLPEGEKPKQLEKEKA
ncbi:hypothetical protein PYW07_000602 [Mythimna separata]|uniref:Uncharacterized protein n=1 Tax=Mythimna separata TaxID=271217 RepID=A0AAD7Z4M5_MYTSE|nr:hypothetical protein PYW07_000602 [Mythimna separata]